MYGVLAVTIVIVIIACAAFPILEDVNSSTKDASQNTAQQYLATSNLTGSLTIAATGSGTTIGTYTTPIADLVVLTDTFGIRNPGGSALYLDCLDVPNMSTEITNVTLSPGVLSYTASEVEYTKTYSSFVIYAAESGDYGLFIMGDELNFNEETVLYTFMAQNVKDSDNVNHYCVAGVSGTYDDLNSTFCGVIEDGVATSTSLTMELADVTENDGYLTYTVGVRPVTTLEGYTGVASYEGMFAPITYYEDSDISILIGILPLLLILIPVMMAVTLITNRRD